MHPLEARLRAALTDDGLVRIVFSHKRKKSLPCKKVTLRPVRIAERTVLQAEYTFDRNVTHRNLDADRAVSLAMELVTDQFKQVNIFTASEDVQILAAKPDRPHITVAPSTRGMPSLAHDRRKTYLIPEDTPCDFLIRLGVMTPEGKVVPRHYAKFRQINRYLEIVEEVRGALPQHRPLRIIDFGCGKAYLTFALYHYLCKTQGMAAEIIGLDLKPDVIRFCARVAEDLHYDGLQFRQGDIACYAGERADMVSPFMPVTRRPILRSSMRSPGVRR